MNKTIDTLKKHNRIILFIFAAIEIITGLFSFSTVVVTDGINNILFGAYSLKKQNKTARLILYIVSLIGSIILFFIGLNNLTKNIGYYEQSPQIWVLPVPTIAFLIKLFICSETEDVVAREEYKTQYKPYAKLMRLSAVSTCITAVAVVACYWSYYIDPAVTFGLSALCAIAAIKEILPPKKQKTKKEKSSKKLFKKRKKKELSEDVQDSSTQKALVSDVSNSEDQ